MVQPWTRWLLWLQWALLAAVVVGTLASKFELLPFRPAFMTFYYAIQGVVLLSGLVLLVALFSVFTGRKAWAKPLWWALGLGALPVAVVLVTVGKGLSVPAIHNITTDLDNPPAFAAAYELDVERRNSLDLPDEDVRAQQKAFYPDLAPLTLAGSREQVMPVVLKVLEQQGLTLIATDAEAGRVEAFEETLLFGFKDDVVIRLTQVGEQVVVDVRSVSRVGRSDLGANAKRIKRLLTGIERAYSS